MNLESYGYNGFKLYERSILSKSMYTYENEELYCRLIIQYKDGIPFKAWVEKEADDWVEETYFTLHQTDKFLENLTEEEVFGILL